MSPMKIPDMKKSEGQSRLRKIRATPSNMGFLGNPYGAQTGLSSGQNQRITMGLSESFWFRPRS